MAQPFKPPVSGFQSPPSAAQAAAITLSERYVQKLYEDHQKAVSTKRLAIAIKTSHKAELEMRPHTEGHTVFLRDVNFPPVEQVLQKPEPVDSYIPTFDNMKMALVYRDVLREEEKFRPDPTLPSNSQMKALVGILFRAFKSIEAAEDGEAMVKPFREQRHDNKLVEIVCWTLLDALVRRATADCQLVIAYEPAKAKTNPTYMTFAERFDACVDSMRKSKTICKHLFDVPYVCTFVDDPSKAESRISANRKLNGQKAHVMALGRANLTEDDKKVLGIKDSPALKVPPPFTKIRPKNQDMGDDFEDPLWGTGGDNDEEYKPTGTSIKKRRINVINTTPRSAIKSSPVKSAATRNKLTPRSVQKSPKTPYRYVATSGGCQEYGAQPQGYNDSFPPPSYMGTYQNQAYGYHPFHRAIPQTPTPNRLEGGWNAPPQGDSDQPAWTPTRSTFFAGQPPQQMLRGAYPHPTNIYADYARNDAVPSYEHVCPTPTADYAHIEAMPPFDSYRPASAADYSHNELPTSYESIHPALTAALGSILENETSSAGLSRVSDTTVEEDQARGETVRETTESSHDDGHVERTEGDSSENSQKHSVVPLDRNTLTKLSN